MRPAGLAPAAALVAVVWMSAASAREVLTPEEQAERELAKRRAAPPVLVCEPTSLRIPVKRGVTRAVRLSIRNAGGRVLSWAVISAPKWAHPEQRSGELGFGEKRSLVLTIDPEGLPGGETMGEVVVEAPEADGSPVTIKVAVVLPEGPPPEERPRPEPRAPERAAPGPPKSRKPRTWRLGLLAAAVEPLPGSGMKYQGNGLGMFLVRFGANGTRRKGIEFGFGFTRINSEEDADEVYSRLLIGRARALFPAVGGLYLTAGGQIVSEEAGYPGSDSKEHLRGTVDVGAMYRLGGQFEVSAAYSLLIGSKNIPGLFEFGVGVTF